MGDIRQELGLLAATPEEVIAASEREALESAGIWMDREEAEAAVGRIRLRLSSIRADLLDLYERQGWRALKYRSWRECAAAEFDLSQPRVYQELTAGRIESELSTMVEIGRIPERQLRPLAALKEAEDWRRAWSRAHSLANGSGITVSLVERAVKELIDQRNTDELILVEEQSPVNVKPIGSARLNRTNNKVDWAWWTWNPVTGCLHDCPYCYARDIANRFYAQGFKPTFLPDRLMAPHNTPVPDDPAPQSRRVFTCSMADLFGKWVPQEWIDAVFEQVRDNPQWEFLFLTKFPQRLAEIDWPANAWVGTTVDRQYRVDIAEKAFRGVKAGVKWLSCEPMLEPLKFSSLEMFDWVVIGGASKSTRTEESWPDFDWVVDLYNQARQSGCKVYFKPNAFSCETRAPKEEPRSG